MRRLRKETKTGNSAAKRASMNASYERGHMTQCKPSKQASKQSRKRRLELSLSCKLRNEVVFALRRDRGQAAREETENRE
jgi:hypothetical protein